MEIAAAHPEAGCPRLRAYARVFEAWGARVRVFEGADNCVRRTPSGFVVEVEGTANLVHEIAHALVAGRLEDDHGFDYGKIPVDPTRAEGRAILFDELTACAMSCAFSRRDVHAWFREQIGIQHVFYGAADVHELVARTAPVVVAHAHGLRAFERRVRARFDRALVAVGAPAWIRRPIASICLDDLWKHHVEELERGASMP
ncbi:MAG: hypothetical protein D6705_15710 [Deltaproteobacteria bacterium]|nr:MAG: hypothetical protein D6705_15710 [Deltaproteobacteria bacterium]